MNKAQAKQFVGLTKVSKMPCLTLNLPARDSCPRGGKLAKVEGTVCHSCYAAKGFFRWPSAVSKQRKNFLGVEVALKGEKASQDWLGAFTRAMRGEYYFRWHSSGDIFSEAYAKLIRKAISMTPHVQHWIPTKEARMGKYFEGLPNVVFRVSHDMKDTYGPQKHTCMSAVTSRGTILTTAKGSACKAPEQDGECGTCRKCWDKTIPLVIYKEH